MTPAARRALAGAAVLTAVLAACTSDDTSSEEFVPTSLVDAPGEDALAADGAVIPVGEWGVVRSMSTEDEPTTVAIRMTNVVAGEAGDLGDVTIFGVENTDSLVPYHVAYVFGNLSGDPTYTPSQSFAAIGPGDPITLSLPASQVECDPPAAMDFGAGLGIEMRGCATPATRGPAPTALVFQGPAGSSEGVTFELPAPTT